MGFNKSVVLKENHLLLQPDFPNLFFYFGQLNPHSSSEAPLMATVGIVSPCPLSESFIPDYIPLTKTSSSRLSPTLTNLLHILFIDYRLSTPPSPPRSYLTNPQVNDALTSVSGSTDPLTFFHTHIAKAQL